MNNTIFSIIIRYVLVLFFKKSINLVEPVSPKIAYNEIVEFCKKSYDFCTIEARCGEVDLVGCGELDLVDDLNVNAALSAA